MNECLEVEKWPIISKSYFLYPRDLSACMFSQVITCDSLMMTDEQSSSPIGWSPLCILIDDGHFDDVILGMLYSRITTDGIDTVGHFGKLLPVGKRVWHLSAPGLSLTTSLRQHAQIRTRLLLGIQSYGPVRQPNAHLQVYVLVGVHDFAAATGCFANLTTFLARLFEFLEELHELLPNASITWLGPGSWHSSLRNSEILHQMHASILTVNSIKPYIAATDISLGMTAKQAGPYVDHWTEAYRTSRIEFLQLLFEQHEYIASDHFLRRELQLFPCYVRDSPMNFPIHKESSTPLPHALPTYCRSPSLEPIYEDKDIESIYETPKCPPVEMQVISQTPGLWTRLMKHTRRKSQ